jgi:hypothetical protein
VAEQVELAVAHSAAPCHRIVMRAPTCGARAVAASHRQHAAVSPLAVKENITAF